MFKFPVRKCYFIAKIGVLLLLVVTILSLFEQWRGGKRSARAELADPLEEEYERQILEDEARIVPGLGADGAPAYLTGDEKRLGEETEKKFAINTFLSDRIAYNRTLADYRNPACARVQYDAELPSASVIIIFHNEPYSVVVRTIHSVLDTARRDRTWHARANFVDRASGRPMSLGYAGQDPNSEFVYLKEIILVDDNSTLAALRGKLRRYVRTRLPAGMVRLLRLPDRQGLMRARTRGARAARGDVLVFLDAHCEGGADWLRPLLQRIRHKRDAVVTPVVDVVDQTSFRLDAAEFFQVGGFTFAGHFTWVDVPEREKKRRGSDIAPTWSPTMAGGLFAIARAYYWELGAYDEQMAGWGGENLEMSFRIWQCGGTLETIPCSRVGHVFRAFHPFGLPAESDTHGINTARMAEVWMDDYAELYYLHRPDLRNNPLIGDVTHRKVLREKLRCKSFQWFLDNVYPEKFVPVRDARAYGRVRNPASNLCLDTMQRDGEASPLGLYPCHAALSATQYLALSLDGQLRDEEQCAELQFTRRAAEEGGADGEARRVLMVSCAGKQRAQQWRWLPSRQLQHAATGQCVDARGAAAGADAAARACADTPAQRWEFDYGEDAADNAGAGGVLSAEQEERLRRLRGRRRKSRSLHSEPSPADAPDDTRDAHDARDTHDTRDTYDTRDTRDARRRHSARDRRKRRKPRAKRKGRKKSRKNKFVLVVERTLLNGSAEHLELVVRCAHRRLRPDDRFVRDLVTILNERDIRVINNGRVFERNRVTQLAKPDPRTKRHRKKKVLEKMALPAVDSAAPAPAARDSPPAVDVTEPKAPLVAGRQRARDRLVVEDFVEVRRPTAATTTTTTTTATTTIATTRERVRWTHERAPSPPDQSLEDSPLLLPGQRRGALGLQDDAVGLQDDAVGLQDDAVGRQDDAVERHDDEVRLQDDDGYWTVGSGAKRDRSPRPEPQSAERARPRAAGGRAAAERRARPAPREDRRGREQDRRTAESEESGESRAKGSAERGERGRATPRGFMSVEVDERTDSAEARPDVAQTVHLDGENLQITMDDAAPGELVLRGNLTFSLADELLARARRRGRTGARADSAER